MPHCPMRLILPIKAMQDNNEIKLGANVIGGQITYKAVAEAFGLDYTPVDKFL